MRKSNNKNKDLKHQRLNKKHLAELEENEDEKDGAEEDSSGSGGFGASASSMSVAGARSAKAAIDAQVKSERTSPLAEMLRADFLQGVRGDLKAAGHKVDALDNKQQMTERKQHAAELNNEAGGGGPNVVPHPALPRPEGIADNFVTPDSENPAAAMDAPELQLKQKLSHSKKQTLKAEAKLKQQRKLQNVPRPKPSSAPRLTRD